MSEELRSKILLLLDARHRSDASRTVGDTEISDELQVAVAEVKRQLDILEEQGLTREANSFGGHNAWISPRGMIAAEKLRSVGQRQPTLAIGGRQGASSSPTMKLFISHSSRDRATAAGLIDLLRSALGLTPADIRCTSVAGYGLPVGADTDEHLRRELLEARAFIGIVSEASISSAYVLFELGARWGMSLHLAPILAAGAPVTLLRGPLAGLHALRCDIENELHQLVSDIGSVLGISHQPVGAYRPALLKLVSAAPPESDKPKVSSTPREVTLTPPQEVVVKGLVAFDADYLYVSDLAAGIGWKELRTQAIVDELAQLEVLSRITGEAGLKFGLSVQGRSLALRLGFLD